ncbi:MAG: hypothetical protein ACLQQ4_05755 [Bacteroidia bacterium]
MAEEEGYLVYRKFFSIVEAEPLLEFLKEKGIDYRVNNYNSNIGSTFASTNNPNQVEVKLLPAQFEVADNLLEQDVEDTINSLPADYYLFSFSENELMEILRKPDEWTPEDYILAQQLLKKRGKIIHQESLHAMKMERLEELRQPEKGNKAWNMAGYAASILGGFFGILMGWYMMSSRKILPNGESVYAYDTDTRLSGKRMALIGAVFMVVWFILIATHYAR